MSILWQGSLQPWFDPNGAPRVGAKAYFYAAGTTTPLTTYADAAFDTPNDHPVLSLSDGRFPPVFLQEGDYHLQVTDSGDVPITDVDNISVPITEDDGGGGGGDTPVELLARTGDVKFRYGTGVHSGWVRLNGRTIGSAVSGASERANNDTSDLFQFLWAQDTSLVVSGGRGMSAAGDFAANKTIQLPDGRSRALIGLAAMGNTLTTLLAGNPVDNGESTDTLGATVGVGQHAITIAQMPLHDHGGGTGAVPDHSHTVPSSAGVGQGAAGPNSIQSSSGTMDSSPAGAHNHTINGQGSNQAHPNAQPSMLLSIYIKL